MKLINQNKFLKEYLNLILKLKILTSGQLIKFIVSFKLRIINLRRGKEF